jgi:hypothetical protein
MRGLCSASRRRRRSAYRRRSASDLGLRTCWTGGRGRVEAGGVWPGRRRVAGDEEDGREGGSTCNAGGCCFRPLDLLLRSVRVRERSGTNSEGIQSHSTLNSAYATRLLRLSAHAASLSAIGCGEFCWFSSHFHLPPLDTVTFSLQAGWTTRSMTLGPIYVWDQHLRQTHLCIPCDKLPDSSICGI